jgi:hypothetical protein
MLKIDENLLNELGLGALPADEKRGLLGHLLETLELRVGMKLAQQLSDEQLDEFENLLPTPSDSQETRMQKEKAALSWLEKHFPDYRKVVADELETLKAEIRQDAPRILAASQERIPPAAAS